MAIKKAPVAEVEKIAAPKPVKPKATARPGSAAKADALLINRGDAYAIAEGRHYNPFSVLGAHPSGADTIIRAFVPGAEAVVAMDSESASKLLELEPIRGADGVFVGKLLGQTPGFAYRLRAKRGSEIWEIDDPYRFGPVLGELDEHFLAEGSHRKLWHALGAHVMKHQGVKGTHFAVWAPNAERVSVVGDFNHWDGRRHAMRVRGSTGVWEIFLPGIGGGDVYKYEIVARGGHVQPLKADPVGFQAEHRPATASVVADIRSPRWKDDAWMAGRGARHERNAPISIYEVHLGSWKRTGAKGEQVLTYRDFAVDLVNYAKDLGFTHIELLPVTEHPFDGSWGYQPVGLYAPTSRFGTPEDFRYFVNAAHEAGIGVILDWVPAHFPTDAHGLEHFDGSHLYEHTDMREGYHPDWNTLIFNMGRTEVVNYLTSNALFWMGEYHIDCLRVDAVASMLYRDYSRKEGAWIPNKDGGRENWESVAFLKQMNELVYFEFPGAMTVAEESTAWPGVSKPTFHGGLGFGYKWNMGWMHDTLEYMKLDPVHRKYHHNEMTFGLLYAFSENFILPLSHDEVVHGKGSLLDRMPGWGDDKFANLRAYYGFMWGHPGKKLLFMGCEFAQGAEWDHQKSLDWHQLKHPKHKGVQSLVRDLNAAYKDLPALHKRDCDGSGFDWIIGDAAQDSVFASIRYGDDGDAPVIVISNLTPVLRTNWRIGVPKAGRWVERINTDAAAYAGWNNGNNGGVVSQKVAAHGRDQSIELVLPPLSTLILEWKNS